MEMVAQDDQEVIVHVYYDFTPVPARALDLYIKYNHDILTLVEARALKTMVLHGKNLATTHLADGTLRLSVYDTTGTHPIPNGPVVELVFSRHGESSTLIAFSKKDEHQMKAVAPLQGNPEIQALLANDALWGPGVLVPELSQVTTKLRLWYGFDQAANPLNYSNVPDAAELCDDYSPCANEPDEVEKAELMSRLEALQKGSFFGGQAIDGLAGTATYLDGSADHLRLPVHYRKPLAPSAQSFSASTWFYSEGNSANELKQSSQVVMDHLAFSERTRFGLALKPAGNDLMNLVFFAGDLLGKAPPPIEVVMAASIPERTWHYAGFALDAVTGKVDLYFDGERVDGYVFDQPPAAVSCPQFFAGANVVLHDEGDILGGKPSQFVYTAVKQGGLYKIRRTDPSGLSETEILGDSEHSFRDPDYSPAIDRLVYSTNVSGDWEIWMAHGDGSGARQITVGFGDSGLGISARRPRFAPDSSAIVFDSNAFSALAYDNDYAHVRHLYYIKYDPVANQVSIAAPGGVVLEQLDYSALVTSQSVGAFRLTGAVMNRQHFNPRWLKGKNLEDGTLGELLFAAATPGWKGYRIHRLIIADPIQLSQVDEVGGLGEEGQDFQLLAAHHAETPAIPQPLVTEQLFYNRSTEIFDVEEQFQAAAQASQVGENNEFTVAVSHMPSGYDANCWDRNHNQLQDEDEDRNLDKVWDVVDCYPAEVRDLFVEFDPSIYVPILEQDGAPYEVGSVVAADPYKKLDLSLAYPAGRAFVRVEVLSPLSANPLAAGEVAVLHFKKFPAPFIAGEQGYLASMPDNEFQSFERLSVDTLVVRDLVGTPPTSCSDDVMNGEESDIDCGGACAGCEEGDDCAGDDDCASLLCHDSLCVLASCGNGKLDDDESDVDCGGNCGHCDVGKTCKSGEDCATVVCGKVDPGDETGTCEAAACDDGIRNGKETDIDCGGDCPDKCGAGKFCLMDGDCQYNQCLEVFCAADHCGDGIKNPGNTETDVDCGGECRPCAIDKACESGLDCISGVCHQPDGQDEFVCASGTCGDGLKNGAETDVDCGGNCGGCGSGQLCLDDLDCAGEVCAGGQCAGGVFATAGLIEFVRDAVFSPNGTRLLLDAISKSRPVLLRTANVATAVGAEKVFLQPRELRGLDWVRQDRFMACNWVGGYAHPQNKSILWGLRGGLDDLKIFSGLRDPDAFRSEAERGRAFLEKNGMDGELESKLPTCANNHLECPDFHLCVDNECTMVACDPSDPYGCVEYGGRCTLRPPTVEQEYKDQQGSDLFEWVCAADCNVDAQCYGQACLNGPCLYCDPVSLTCAECKETLVTLGELTYATIEGCPDSNSFRCEAGACVTNCYNFADDQSVYLCNPGLEYCYQGECVLHDWDWWDVAPASFQGGHASPLDVPPDPSVGWHGYTQAVDQRIPVKITAYGVADFGAPPEVAVEVRGGPFYGGDWNRLVNASVNARTMAEAQQRPIVAVSPYPFDALRLRLITSPYNNLDAANTGLADGDKDFCLADLDATAKQAGQVADPSVCFRRAQGSRFWLGYRSEIPMHEAMAACKEHGLAACPQITMAEHNYLWGGQPAAVILGVEVDGGSVMNAIASDRICPYGGYGNEAQIPLADGAPKKLYYGDISTEVSPQQAALCQADPEACEAPGGSGLIDFDHEGKAFGLLNCNVYDPDHAGATAGMVFTNIPIVKPWPASSGSIVIDNGNQCIVEVNDMLTTACYEWDDASGSLDGESAVVSSGESTPIGSLLYGIFRSFGHDEGFEVIPRPLWPLTLEFIGYNGQGLKILCGDMKAAIPDGAEEYLGCPKVKEGRRIKVSVFKQPTTGELKCVVLQDVLNNKMPPNGTTVSVFCGVLFPLTGTVSGMGDGTLKLLGEMTYPGVSAATKELLNVTENGPFIFSTEVPEGGTYKVSVAASPIGYKCQVTSKPSGTVGKAAVTGIAVTCKKSDPHYLQVTVTGVQGKGLTLLEKISGSTVSMDNSGTAQFPKKFYEGEPYEIAVDELPVGPKQNCVVTADYQGGAGTMGVGDTMGAKVKCDTLASAKVQVSALGLMYGGLKLSLNGDAQLSLDPPTSSAEAKIGTFATSIFVGDSYSVSVVSHPSEGASQQVCNVLNGQGTYGGDNGPIVVHVVCLAASTSQGHKLGGTVSGLKGSGLYLSYSNQVGKIAVLKAEGGGDVKFHMAGELMAGTDYTVEVATQPSDPIQYCTVKNGTGTMPDEQVENIKVVCEDAFIVQVELDLSDFVNEADEASPNEFNGADVSIRGYRLDLPTPSLVALAPADAKIKAGKATFLMRDIKEVKQGEEAPVAYLPGMQPGAGLNSHNYRFYLFVNRDNDKVVADPFYEASVDYGMIIEMPKVESGNVKTISIKGSTSGFLPLGWAEVKVYEDSEGVVAEGVTCWWLLPEAKKLTGPPAGTGPVVMTAKWICTDNDDNGHCGAWDGDWNFTGNTYEGKLGLPRLLDGNATAYKLQCWADSDNSGVINDDDEDCFIESITDAEFGAGSAKCTLKPL